MSQPAFAKVLVSLCLSFLLVIPARAQFEESERGLCMNPKEVADDSNSKFVATSFPEFESVPPHLQELLENYLTLKFGTAMGPDLPQAYAQWMEKYNEQASSFFGILHALASIQVKLGGNVTENGLQMVMAIAEVKGDRLRALLDPRKLEEWRQAGGGYSMRNGNKYEEGQVKFVGHSTMSGSIHCGYDIQGSTNRKNPPSIQWNFRFKDSMADIDLDGRRAMIWKVIPNPKHYSYRNSDVRFWFDSFYRKFGSPGFKVELRKKHLR